LQEFGQIAMDARPELPPFKQMLNPGAWKDAAAQSGQKLTNAFGQMESQLLGVYEDIEDEFCRPAAFQSTVKLPTEITMPGFYIGTSHRFVLSLSLSHSVNVPLTHAPDIS
jgi:hypothetical protein